MTLHTYDSIKIWQQGDVPAIGDKVEGMTNQDITITDNKGNKALYEVRDGVISRVGSTIKWAETIITVVFILMMILMFYLIWLWVA
jgi:hypothetical protein